MRLKSGCSGRTEATRTRCVTTRQMRRAAKSLRRSLSALLFERPVDCRVARRRQHIVILDIIRAIVAQHIFRSCQLIAGGIDPKNFFITGYRQHAVSRLRALRARQARLIWNRCCLVAGPCRQRSFPLKKTLRIDLILAGRIVDFFLKPSLKILSKISRLFTGSSPRGSALPTNLLKI